MKRKNEGVYEEKEKRTGRIELVNRSLGKEFSKKCFEREGKKKKKKKKKKEKKVIYVHSGENSYSRPAMRMRIMQINFR